MNAPANDRARAARHLLRIIIDGKTTDQTFGLDLTKQPSPLCQELVFGTLRYYYSLNDAVEERLSKSLRSKDFDLRLLLLVGAYQLRHMRIPDHAAINETVNACRPLRKPWAQSLVNAVLRSIAKEANEQSPDNITERSVESPKWISERIETAFPKDAADIMMGLLDRAPMSLRVNTARVTAVEYQDQLDSLDIAWQAGLMPEHLILTTPIPAARLPGYQRGLVSIQDGGALLAPDLLDPDHSLQQHHNTRILDACAAPGGKLFHLAERIGPARLVALERNPRRLEHLCSEAKRLDFPQIEMLEADATTLGWWDKQPFDAILLDAPCSGIGTLRRHPDIKHLRQVEDLVDYQQLQLSLLRNLWRTLAAEGTLLYCTCSLFQEENDNVVQQFLNETNDAQVQRISAPVGQATHHGWQLLPSTRSDTNSDTNLATSVDGFYYARLHKTSGNQEQPG
jgi:16S rRNA (cytosine967-C5)-methyltransferase